jgi:hypothetical protein
VLRNVAERKLGFTAARIYIHFRIGVVRNVLHRDNRSLKKSFCFLGLKEQRLHSLRKSPFRFAMYLQGLKARLILNTFGTSKLSFGSQVRL